MSPREFTAFTAILMSIVALSIDALLPAFGEISREIEVSNANQVQLIISFLFIGLAVGQLICGPLSDAFGRKPVLYVTLIIYFVGTLICYFANTIEVLLCGRFVQGLGVAGPNIAAYSLVRDRFKGRQMAKIMSLVMMIFVMVPAVAPAIGQLVMLVSNWRWIFVVYIAYSAIIFAWILFRLEESLPSEKRIPFTVERLMLGFKEVLSNQRTTRMMLAKGVMFGSLIGFINSCQQIIQEQFDAGKMFSVYFGLLALMLGASALFNSRNVERLGMYFLASQALYFVTVSSILFLLAQLFLGVNLLMFLIYAATLFGSYGLIFGNLNAMAMEPMGHLAGIASAVIGATSSLLSIILGTFIGQLYDGTVLPITMGSLCLALVARFLMSRSGGPSHSILPSK